MELSSVTPFSERILIQETLFTIKRSLLSIDGCDFHATMQKLDDLKTQIPSTARSLLKTYEHVRRLCVIRSTTAAHRQTLCSLDFHPFAIRRATSWIFTLKLEALSLTDKDIVNWIEEKEIFLLETLVSNKKTLIANVITTTLSFIHPSNPVAFSIHQANAIAKEIFKAASSEEGITASEALRNASDSFGKRLIILSLQSISSGHLL